MAEFIRDDIDFDAYLRATECKAKVRPATIFAESLKDKFAPKASTRKAPESFSTKLAGRLPFRPGEVTVWAGYNGHKKSMLTGQVMLDLCAQGQRVLMASLEMQPEETLARMARQFAAKAKPDPAELDRFSRWTDGRLWIFDHLGRVSPDKMLAVITYFANELGGQHICIDSLMMTVSSEENLDPQKQFLTDLVRASQELRVHVHLVAHCRKPASGDEKPPTKYDLRGSAAISDQAANVVMVWANKPKTAAIARGETNATVMSQPDVRIAVEKQRNGSFEGGLGQWFDPASLRFVNDRGEEPEPYGGGPFA